MTRFRGFYWFIVALGAGMVNFFVAHAVQGLDDRLDSVRRQTVAAQKEIHELTADWTYLNQPELLADLNRRYVGLVPESPRQLVGSIEDIPLRPPPATPPAPAPDIAANPPSPELVAMPAVAAAASPTGLGQVVPIHADPAQAVALQAAPAPAVPAPAVPAPATPVVMAAAAPAPHMVPAAVRPARPARPANLDALFAQVAETR